MKKYIGVTLLFQMHEDKKIFGLLKSFVLSYSGGSFEIFLRRVEKFVQAHLKQHGNLKYLGVEDVFYVSSEFNRGTVLGKAYLSRHNTLSKAQKMVSSKLDFELSSHGTGWNLVSVIYFSSKSKESIACLTAMPDTARQLSIKRLANSLNFRKKIVSPLIDGISPRELVFVGIERIIPIEEDPLKGGAFQIYYKRFKDQRVLNTLLPTKTKLERKFATSAKKSA